MHYTPGFHPSLVRRQGLGLTLALCAVALAQPSLATTVAPFTLGDQVTFAQIGVRVQVTAIDLRPRNWTRYTLAIRDDVFGNLHETEMELDLLTDLVGNPTLRTGEEYLLFLNLDNRIERIIGLSWGTYVVKDDLVFDHKGNPLALEPLTDADTPLSGVRVATDAYPRGTGSASPVSYLELRERALRLRHDLSANGVAVQRLAHE